MRGRKWGEDGKGAVQTGRGESKVNGGGKASWGEMGIGSARA